MIGYFKRQSSLFMALGAVLAVLVLIPVYRVWLPRQEFYIRAFYVALPAFVGVILGRLFAAWWANRRIRAIDGLLYEQNDPTAFIRAASPLVERVPKETIEYINGCLKLAYAYEAMGEYEKSLGLMEELDPSALRLHALAACSLLANQRARVYLLLEDTENAGKQLEELKRLKETAVGRTPALAKNLEGCIRLVTVWLEFLKGESCDEAYIAEERDLAKNPIHREEMERLLTRMRSAQV